MRPKNTHLSMSANQLHRKLKNERGESLLELLAAILMGTIAITLLTTTIVTAVRINKAAKQKDTLYYESLTAAGIQQGPSVDSQVQIHISGQGGSLGSVTIDVSCYGSDGLYSYKMR